MGNWLVDCVKLIERYPAPGNLATIRRVETGLGGCAHNVLVDLARMQSGIPLYAGGCIGPDARGRYILDEIRRHGIDDTHMHVAAGTETSYTDVMSETDGGKTRTFFHFRGGNAALGPQHLAAADAPARIFHLGYLLLLDELDKPDPEYGVVAARALHDLQKRGYETSVDVVSEESDRFREIVLPCLPYVDYLIVNEVEAGACCRTALRDADGTLLVDAVAAAARQLIDHGVGKCCIIHFPEGGYALTAQGESRLVASQPVPAAEIVSTVGAGDAFCAGALYAIHERMPLERMLVFANTSARFNLRSATSTGGAPTLAEIETYMNNL